MLFLEHRLAVTDNRTDRRVIDSVEEEREGVVPLSGGGFGCMNRLQIESTDGHDFPVDVEEWDCNREFAAMETRFGVRSALERHPDSAREIRVSGGKVLPDCDRVSGNRGKTSADRRTQSVGD